LRKSGAEEGRFGRSSSGIAGVSIAISVIIMVLTIAILDGFKREIRLKASGFSGELVMHSPGVDITTSLYPVDTQYEYLKEIGKMHGISAIYPFAYRSGVLKHGDEIQGVLIKGVNRDFDWSFFDSVMKEGATSLVYSDTLGNNGIVISDRLAKMLGYSVGDAITIYFIDDNIKVRLFKLVGIYDAQLEDIDKTLVLTDISVIRQLNGWKDNEASGIEVRLKDGTDGVKKAMEIEDLILDSSEDTMFVTRVDEMFPHLFDWLKLLDINAIILLFLMIAVAGFNMISGLLILLFKKISMIGILKALGMRDSDIHKIFILRSMRIVVTAMLIGNIVAFILIFLQSRFDIISLNVSNYFVDSVPMYITWPRMALFNMGAIIVIMFLLFIPSSFISKVSPEKSLRVK
jgi:ABC-type transport system, involved in lipoprotein release, permease component